MAFVTSNLSYLGHNFFCTHPHNIVVNHGYSSNLENNLDVSTSDYVKCIMYPIPIGSPTRSCAFT